MNDVHDKKLDSMLRYRRIEARSSDLAERITLQARKIPQAQNISLWQLIRQLFAEFHLPKPGYVLASALVLGMAVGFNAPLGRSAPKDVNLPNSQNFFAADEALL